MELTKEEKELLIESLLKQIIEDQNYIIQSCKQIRDYDVLTELITPKEMRIAESKKLIKKLKS